jgi:hypothetical protein
MRKKTICLYRCLSLNGVKIARITMQILLTFNNDHLQSIDFNFECDVYTISMLVECEVTFSDKSYHQTVHPTKGFKPLTFHIKFHQKQIFLELFMT